MYTDNNVVKARGRGTKGMKIREICNSVNNFKNLLSFNHKFNVQYML